MSKETDHSITSSNIKIVDKKRLYFVHLNINDILTKVEQLRSLLINSNIFVLRKTETKLYNTVNNEEVATDGYNLIRPDRNRKGWGIASCIKPSLSFNYYGSLSKNIENILINILLTKSKPIHWWLSHCVERINFSR